MTVGEKITFGSESPFRGKFDMDNSPQMRAPLDALRDPDVRMVTVSGAAQTAKTLIGMFFVFDCLCGSTPANTQWNAPTDKAAKKFAEGKFWKLARRYKPFLEKLPANPDRVRIMGVDFPDLQFVIQTASENNAHGDSICYQVNDDVQQWDQGMLKKFHDRTTAFTRQRKVLNLMTGMQRYHRERAADGSLFDLGDDAHNAYKAGTCEVWNVRCPACSRLQPEVWEHRDERDEPVRDAAGKKIRGIIYDENEVTKPRGRWDLDQLALTARWRCIGCGHEIHSSPAAIRELSASGEYVATNPRAPRWHRSFTWPAMASELIGWGLLVQEYVQALDAMRAGDMEPLRIFVKNRLAGAWFEGVETESVSRATGDYKMAEPWADALGTALEEKRYLTIDTQRAGQQHYKWLLRAWSRTHGSRLLGYGTETSFEGLRRVQLAHNVTDRRVLIDTGDGAHTHEIYAACVKYGWRGLKGDDAEAFAWPNPQDPGRPVMRSFSMPFYGDPGAKGLPKKAKRERSRRRRAQREGVAMCFRWSNLAIKNKLARFRDGKASYWGRPSDEDPEYTDGLYSESLVLEQGKKPRWVKTKQNNHPWDLECMQIVAAEMGGMIRTGAGSAAAADQSSSDSADQPA